MTSVGKQETDADANDDADAEELRRRLEERDERIEELQDEIEEKDERIDDLESRVKRVQADFQNYKKRMKRKQEEIREHATEDLVERLLDVRDDLKRALEADAGDVDDIREGVKMTLAELDRVLDAEGVSGIEPDPGDEVDPTKHEVMLRIDGDNPEDTIEDVYNQGYEMGSKVLRPAQVTVSNGAGADDSAAHADAPDTEEADGDEERDQRE